MTVHAFFPMYLTTRRVGREAAEHAYNLLLENNPYQRNNHHNRNDNNRLDDVPVHKTSCCIR